MQEDALQCREPSQTKQPHGLRSKPLKRVRSILLYLSTASQYKNLKEVLAFMLSLALAWKSPTCLYKQDKPTPCTLIEDQEIAKMVAIFDMLTDGGGGGHLIQMPSKSTAFCAYTCLGKALFSLVKALFTYLNNSRLKWAFYWFALQQNRKKLIFVIYSSADWPWQLCSLRV